MKPSLLQGLFLIFFGLKIAAELFLNARYKRHILKGKNEVPAAFRAKISQEEHTKAANYTLDKLNFSCWSLLIDLVIFLLLFPAGGINLINSIAVQVSENTIVQGLLFFAFYSLVSLILHLPEKLYSTFVIEQKHGFNKTTPKIFLGDLLKQIVLGAFIMLPLLYALLFFIEFTSWWWLYGWLLFSAFQFFILWAYPTFIAPLFNEFSPLEDQTLVERIHLLVEKVGFQLNGLFIMNASLRSSHGNAYFSGLGKSKRIVFFDTLLKSLTHDEVEAVLAHELGHFKLKHIQKNLIKSLLFSLAGFYILSLLMNQEWFYQGHFINQAKPYLGLFLFSAVTPIYLFFLSPLGSYFSRKHEYEADNFAAQYSEASSLATALVKLFKENASYIEPEPLYSKVYYSHPPALERIKNLERRVSQ